MAWQTSQPHGCTLHETEHRAATVTRSDRRPRAHWAHDPRWVTYSGTDGERWFGFDNATG
ncbi:hypothetical protein [Micromonospora narathiwatensis]|uniref:hypothetical protein n=1 Tax=Micromonospora narathiwatensis TaxID=299146 RepID=UPI000A634D17|nr:hypothetical protein [Micromonospora narathiwatensis]